jgi:peptidoglycan/LPS O-acetylase OafA/YrhL
VVWVNVRFGTQSDSNWKSRNVRKVRELSGTAIRRQSGVLSVGWDRCIPVGALLYEFHPELARWAQRLRNNVPALALIAFPLVFAIGLWLCLVQGSAGGVLAKLLALISDLMARDAARYWHKLGATIVVAATLHWPFAQTILGSRAGRFLGKISFVLYLIQVPIICSLTSWIFLALAPISVSIAAKVAALSTIIVIFAASAATCWFVDQVPTRLSRAAGRSLDALFRPVPPRHGFDLSAEAIAARGTAGAQCATCPEGTPLPSLGLN